VVAPESRQLSFEGRTLWNGIRRASACSEDPILCVAQGRALTFVALDGPRLVISWRFLLPAAVDGPLVFSFPPMIIDHLLAAPPQGQDAVDLILKGNEVILNARDTAGSYELRWHYDLRAFPAPPEMSRMLAMPAALLQVDYVRVADAVHQAVAKLVSIESQRQIHRTKLAILVGLSHGYLTVDGQEISMEMVDKYYFDPRLIIRALEYLRADQVELGMTGLSPQRAFLSVVNRHPECTVHCALLSIGLETQRLFPLPPRREQKEDLRL